MDDEVYLEPRPLKPSSRSQFIDSPFGTLELWADENGVYVDLYKKDEGNICLMSLHPENFGFSAMIYEKYGEVTPTQRGYFYDVKNAYKHLPILDDAATVNDVVSRIFG